MIEKLSKQLFYIKNIRTFAPQKKAVFGKK